MTEQKETQIHGKPWESCGVFDSYEKASKAMSHLIANNPTYKFKIRRCGDQGSQFKIKKRIDKQLESVSEQIQKTQKNKNKKKSKK